MGLTFDWHISVGTIIEICSLFAGGLFFLYGLKTRIELMAIRVDLMAAELLGLKNEIAQLAGVLTKLAVQDQRILNIEADIKEMKLGFVVRPKLAVT